MVATTRVLFHFRYSPFSRRARLTLAHKGLEHELREAREHPEHLADARARTALKTIPILVDGGHTLGDSTAISHYLDRAYGSSPRLWPEDDAAIVFEVAALVDVALNNIVDVGTRYFALRDSPAWPGVKDEHVGRAQRALDALGDRAKALGRANVAASGWSAADVWLYTMTAWLESLPARASSSQNVAQILTLGYSLPAALSRWADAHRGRADVTGLDA